MANFNYIYPYDINPIYLHNYISKVSNDYDITNIIIENNRNLMLTLLNELTSTQLSNLSNYIENFTNVSNDVLCAYEIKDALLWADEKINEFKVRNLQRKQNGELTRIELYKIMQELHESLIMDCMASGSLDTLYGVLYGFPEEENNQAIQPYNFQYLWAEDVEWFKTELNKFLGIA